MSTTSSARAAAFAIQQGWAPVPIAPGTKKPAPHLTEWQRLRISEEEVPAYWQNGEGVGLLLGELSGGLVDVDLDTPEAARAADFLLPPTGRVHGRPGAPSSHRWYRADPIPKSLRLKDRSGETLVELRSTGGQTNIPPTVHPSGEILVWEGTGEPACVHGEELLSLVQHLAAATLLARVWPSKGRHDATLPLAGALLRAGWGKKKAETFIRAVCAGAGDEEVEDRVQVVSTTAERLRKGGETTGVPTLVETFGEDVVHQLGKWIGLQDGAKRAGKSLSTPRVRCLEQVEPETVTWLWDRRIPRGKLSEIVGDPGEGKSWLVTQLVGMLTTGRTLPGDSDVDRPRESVLLLSAEDGAGDTIRPRLDEAGADLRRVHLLDGIEDAKGNLHLIDLKDRGHRTHLGDVVRRLGVTLIVIDPLAAYLGSTDAHRDSEVRGVLAPLAELAESSRAAILVIRHLNKSSGGKAIYRAGGSIGFTAAVRSSMLVGRVDEDREERALVVVKSNLESFPPPVGFTLEGGRFRWTGEPKVHASDLLRPDSNSDDRSDREEAVDWLRSVLAGGPVESVAIFKRAKDELDVSAATVKRARQTMGDEVVVERENTEGGSRGEGRWVWRLEEYQQVQEDPLDSDTLEQPYSHNAFSPPGVQEHQPSEVDTLEAGEDGRGLDASPDEHAGTAYPNDPPADFPRARDVLP